jgi:ribonucleoside-diphosphate reductase alpha chain
MGGYWLDPQGSQWQAELPMPEIHQMKKLAVNRPVPELSISADSDSPAPKHDRVKTALGGPYMGVICSNCGSDKVIRAGACGCCTQCGTSQGCS